MEKCAKALGGTCKIRFEETQTVVSFKCPATPVRSDLANFRDFNVPAVSARPCSCSQNFEWSANLTTSLEPTSNEQTTFGLALDDSKIQRRILRRILSHVGIERSRLNVMGKASADVDEFSKQLLFLLREHRDAKFLVLVDEILDWNGDPNVGQLSGSCVMKEILSSMTPDQERRVLALVRSANDSQDDIKQYLSRVHGFYPKSPTKCERVRETLAPLWLSRFADQEEEDASSILHASSEDEDDSEISASDILDSMKAVETLLLRLLGSSSSPRQPTGQEWPKIWIALHGLRGDLMMVGEENDSLAKASELIEKLRGEQVPNEFAAKWSAIQSAIVVGANNM